MNWKTTLTFAFMAQFLSILGFSFATPFLPFFVAELGVSNAGSQAFHAGLVLSSGGFTFAIFAPVWGVLADRYGRKSMVCRAMFGGALAILLMSFARTVPQLVACRVLQGVFSGTIAASIALVASVTPLNRSGFALGMMQAAVFVGHVVGPFFGGLAADTFGYRDSFRIGALLTALGGILTLLGTHEDFTPPERGTANISPGFWEILMLPGFLLGVAVLFSVRLSNSIANPSFPLIVRDMVDSQANLNTMTGMIIGAAAVAGAIAAGVLGHTSDRIGQRSVLIACCLVASAASIGHYFAYGLPTLFIARILFGFAVAGMMPVANTLIKAVVDARSIGKAFGLATSISMLGTAFGPMFGGLMAMKTGIRTPFLVTAAGQALLVVLAWASFNGRRNV